MAEYEAPQLAAGDATPILVRDELLKCFESANKEFLTILNQPTSDEALKAQVRGFVTGVFQSCGASFDNPTKAGIVEAIGQCKTNAESAMGPAGSKIIEHHYSEMMKLVHQMPDE
jgi:hypothetical protein